MSGPEETRRRYLGLLAAASAGLAGCAGSDSTAPTGTATKTTNGGATTAEPTGTAIETAEPTRPPRPEYHGWLDDAAGSATTVDAYGENAVTVTIEERDGRHVFSPAAVQVDLGTTVTWEWNADFSHEVAAVGGEFQSETIDSAGESFSHTFEDTGIYRYRCRPHESIGHIGVVVAGREYETVLPDAPFAWYARSYDRFSRPTVVDGTVYAHRGEAFDAYDARNGTETWDVAGVRIGRATVGPGRAYVLSPAGQLVAIDTATGTEEWQYNPGVSLETRPLLTAETVFVGGEAGVVAAVDHDGRERWQRELASEHVLGLAEGPDAVYAAGGVERGGTLYRLSPGGGGTSWEYSSEEVDYSLVAPVVAGGTVYAKGTRSGLFAIDTADGTERWHAPAAIGGRSPVLDGERVYVQRDDQAVVAREMTTGEPVWTRETDTRVETVIAGTDAVYVVDDAGVTTVDPASGDRRAREDGDTVYTETASHRGTVFVADWGLWALEIGDDGDTERPELPVTVDGVLVTGDWEAGVVVVERNE